MAKFQRLKEITEDGWKALDEFYEYEVRGINLYLNNFVRSFCRCGNASATIKDKCSDCENFTFITYKREKENESMYYHNNEILERRYNAYYDEMTNTICYSRYYLYVFENSSKNVEFKIEKKKIIEFNSKRLIYLTKDYKQDIVEICSDPILIDFFENHFEYKGEFDDILSLLPKVIKGKRYRRYYDMVDVDIEVSSLLKMIFAIDLKSYLKDVLKDTETFKYPYILKGFMRDYICYKTEICYVSFSYKEDPKYLKDLFSSKLNKKYYHLLDMSCKNEGSLTNALGGSSWVGNNYSLLSFIDMCENEKYDIESTIMHYVSNGMISYKEGYNIIKKYGYILGEEKLCLFEKSFIYYKPDNIRYWEARDYEKHISYTEFLTIEHLDFFEIYLKENISNIKNDIVESFISQIKTMIDYKIPIKEENFKLKTYNFLVNQVLLADVYKMPQGKVDMFLDMFEVNPLEAMTLLANRRKMTKKEMDAFLEIMFRNT